MLDRDTPAASPAPIAAPPARAPPSETTAPPPSSVLTSAPPPPKKRFDRRHLAWIVPLAVGVVAAGAVGIYFAVRPGDGCHSGLPCVDSTHR